jgi:thermostable 8-oxoguanine DNA glycosylase
MTATAMVLLWKMVEDFQSFVKTEKRETLTLTLKICILQENGFKELTLVLFKRLC